MNNVVAFPGSMPPPPQREADAVGIWSPRPGRSVVLLSRAGGWLGVALTTPQRAQRKAERIARDYAVPLLHFSDDPRGAA